MKNCLLCGVGGQGTVLASRILANAAMAKGEMAQTAETIGMAQRGGCVVSHVRIGADAVTPLIPLGSADVLLSFEPCEAVRNLPYLKEGGIVVTADRPVQPTTLSLNGQAYDSQSMLDYLQAHSGKCYILSTEEVEQTCGSVKSLNVALVGAVAALGVLDLSVEDIDGVLETRVKKQFLEMNRKALQVGKALVK